jgi:hypothetical protein
MVAVSQRLLLLAAAAAVVDEVLALPVLWTTPQEVLEVVEVPNIDNIEDVSDELTEDFDEIEEGTSVSGGNQTEAGKRLRQRHACP